MLLLRLEALLLLKQGVTLRDLVVEVAELGLRVEGQVLSAVIEARMSVDAHEVLLAGLRVAVVAQLSLRADVHLGSDSVDGIGGRAVEAEERLGVAVGH